MIICALQKYIFSGSIISYTTAYVYSEVHRYIFGPKVYLSVYKCFHEYTHMFFATTDDIQKDFTPIGKTISIPTYLPNYKLINVETYIHTYRNTQYRNSYIHLYIYTYIHTYIHTYINTYIHT